MQNYSNLHNKLIHYNLNLDYSINQPQYDSLIVSTETQTNWLINNIINDFIKKFQKSFGKRVFVYEFNDDLPSVVGYIILLVIQSIHPEFTFKLYGKAKNSKKSLTKETKFCSKRELKKNKNVVFITSINSIYKVEKREDFSTILQTSTIYNLVERFTPIELKTAQIFYHIGYIPSFYDKKENKNYLVKINKWLNKPEDKFLLDSNKYYASPTTICLVWIGDNVENNIAALREVEQEDVMAFYFYNEKEMPKILTDLSFHGLVKRTSNRPNPNFFNLNNYELVKAFRKTYNQIKFKTIGDWPQRELQLVSMRGED